MSHLDFLKVRVLFVQCTLISETAFLFAFCPAAGVDLQECKYQALRSHRNGSCACVRAYSVAQLSTFGVRKVYAATCSPVASGVG